MKLHVIDTGLFKLDGGAMFGVVPKSMWHKKYPADDNNMCTWAMRCMLIEDGNNLTLIDTGIGNKQNEKFYSHFYIHGDDTLQNSLQKLGFGLDDITDVILTHLHFDHCGGAIIREGEKLIPQFKNATYYSNEKHWQNATKPNERERASFLAENILPIKESGQLKMLESTEGIMFNNHIEIINVSGHTEGMQLPLINYKGRKILYAADLFPSPLHINLPWIMAYDMQPLLTLAEKKKVLARAMAEDWLIFFEHDATVQLCSLQNTEKGILPKEFIQLSEV